MSKCVVLVGNLSEGFRAHGPYESFDEACVVHENQESWVMTLEPSLEPEDECPNCKNGTLEQGEGELVCRGECGHIFQTT